MKRTLIIISIFAILVGGCGNRPRNADTQEVTFVNNTSVWSVEYDIDNDKFYLVRGNLLDEVKHDIEKTILAWNENSAIKIEFTKIDNGMLYVKIPDAEKLTQRMGSTGAMQILASLVYTLTEKYPYVYIDFDEGDHASPGMFSRNSFRFAVLE